MPCLLQRSRERLEEALVLAVGRVEVDDPVDRSCSWSSGSPANSALPGARCLPIISPASVARLLRGRARRSRCTARAPRGSRRAPRARRSRGTGPRARRARRRTRSSTAAAPPSTANGFFSAIAIASALAAVGVGGGRRCRVEELEVDLAAVDLVVLVVARRSSPASCPSTPSGPTSAPAPRTGRGEQRVLRRVGRCRRRP